MICCCIVETLLLTCEAWRKSGNDNDLPWFLDIRLVPPHSAAGLIGVRLLRLETHRADERTRRVKSLVADLTMLSIIGGVSSPPCYNLGDVPGNLSLTRLRH